MNIIDIQDQLKNFSEQQLISEMQMPTGSAPQFLVLSEIKRRKRVRDDFMKREAANQPTVAQEAIAAAGVPQSGIMGMSEAMAPQAAVAEGGIGSIMPQSMRPQTMPAPTDDAIPMAEGGVIKANIGMFFRPDGTPTEEGIAALIGQESGGDPMARGSKDEVGLTQIRPGTAIMPGYGVQSMFPEISSLIGPGKKYDTNKMSVADAVQKAYEDNKELVDSGLIDPERSTSFSRDYLTAMSKEFPGDPNRALAAYNVGPDAAANLEDPSGFDYVKKVLSRVADAAKSVGSKVAEAAIPSASAANLSEIQALDPSFSKQSQPVMSPPMQDSADESGVVESIFNLLRLNDPKAENYPGLNQMKDMIAGPGSAVIDSPNIGGDIQPKTIFPQNKEGDEVIIPPLLQTEDGEPITQAQAGIVSEDHPDADLPITIVPDRQGTGALVPKDDPQIKAQPDFSAKEESDEESDDANAKETSTQPPIISIGGDASTYQAGSLASEIKALQDKLDKDKETDKYLALAQAGLALMSSKEPTLLGAIGEAGISGLTSFREAQDRYQEGVIDLINARAKLTSKTSSFTANQMIQRAGDLQTMAKNLRENVGTEAALQQAREYEMAARRLLADAGVIAGDSNAMAGFEDE